MRLFPVIILLAASLLFASTSNEEIEFASMYENCAEDFARGSDNCAIRRLFRENYKSIPHEKFDGHVIKIVGSKTRAVTFMFGSDSLDVAVDNDTLLSIFQQGIFYPAIFPGNRPHGSSIHMYLIEELHLWRQSATRKRFYCWKFDRYIINPTVFFFELTNEDASSETDLESFIKGSTLTSFINPGWVII
jgi:hypothetical protein